MEPMQNRRRIGMKNGSGGKPPRNGKGVPMKNVVLSVFAVESEAYQAFSELRLAPAGAGYIVDEAALLKNDAGRISAMDGFGTDGKTSDDTAKGFAVGALVGILGGPLGVLLGASVGALVGNVMDTDDAVNTLSAVEVIANKLFEGEIAVVALVEEEEPAFDAAFQKYETTIIRYDPADIAAEVDRANELQATMANEAREQLRAERKAERKAKAKENQELRNEMLLNASGN